MSVPSVQFSPKVRAVILTILSLSLLTSNPLNTFLAIAFIPVSAKLLLRKNEPPIFFIAMLIQWIQVTIKVFYADFYNEKFPTVFEFPDNIQKAYILSLLGLLAQNIGIWIILRNVKAISRENLQETALRYNVDKLLYVYVICIFLSPVLIQLGNTSGGVQQFVQKITDLKWSLLFILIVAVTIQKRKVSFLYLIIFLEIVLGFTGYFSSFKDYFMILGIIFFMLNPKLKSKHYIVVIVSGIGLFNIFVVWQHIKPEYRKFLSSGEASQTVTVSKKEALQKLTELATEMDSTGYQDGVTRLVDRTTYIDFFSASISYVPRVLPHEAGGLWGGAVLNIFMPRLLFPGKASIDDSKKTTKYTGIDFAGAEEGASISLGYIAETYVDFGAFLMIVPLFLFGLLIGCLYKFLLNTSQDILIGMAFLIPLFFQINLFEMALEKKIGGIIAYALVMLIVKAYGFPKLTSFIKTKSLNTQQRT